MSGEKIFFRTEDGVTVVQLAARDSAHQRADIHVAKNHLECKAL